MNEFLNDGIDHINIYSKGQTELGRFLSNFNRNFIITQDGSFESIEGYWYWLGTRHEGLRYMYGFQAKQFGRKIRAASAQLVVLPEQEFRSKIEAACRIKLQNNPNMLFQFINNKLPLTHYYVFNGIKRDAGFKWILEMWERIKKDLSYIA